MLLLNILENVVTYLQKLVEPKRKGKEEEMLERFQEPPTCGSILLTNLCPVLASIIEVSKDEPPTDEDIEKYYKRYVAKFEEDKEDNWCTEEMMTLEEYSEKAKEAEKYGNGWMYLFSTTSHCMIGSPFGDGPIMFM